MNEADLRRELLLLVGFLLTSAHGLYEEPLGYGPFRLMDAAGRLLNVMEAHGLSDPYLKQLEQAISAERFGPSSDDEVRATLNTLCLEYAAELKGRLARQEDEA